MKNNMKTILSLFVVMLLVISSGTLLADTKDDNFYGNFSFGYRFVDTSGVESKYKEDINLEEGARLFNFNLHYTPDGDLKKLFDRLDLSLNHFGGDPFESLSLSIIKYGKYQLKYDRRKSSYYYNDHLAGEDFHTFDFDRVMDSGMLKYWFSKNTNLYVSFNHYTKKGNSQTTFDIGRIEFEFDKPIDENSKDVSIGLEVNLKRFGFILEEKVQDYENSNSMFLPGYADGGDSARYPTALNYFFLNQPYDMKSNTHTARVYLSPFDSLIIKGSAQMINQDTDVSYSEDISGNNHLGDDISAVNNGNGTYERQITLYDLDLSWMLTSKLAVTGALHYNDFDQTGTWTENGEARPVDLKYKTAGFEAGLQYQPSSTFGITLGVTNEYREIELEMATEENGPTERTGIFGNMNIKLSKAFKITADYQNGSFKIPFTLTSPTDYQRFRLRAKYKAKKCYISGSYLYNINKNDENRDDWKSEKNQLSLRTGHHGEKLKVSVGYNLISVKHQGSRTILYPPSWSGPEGTFLWDILYEGSSGLLDSYIHLSLDKNWGLGGYLNYYKNTGDWELTRFIFKAFLEYKFEEGLSVRAGYRYVNFEEVEQGLNDYTANIFEISFGYRW